MENCILKTLFIKKFRRDHGFTLIELAVTMLVLGILSAIAIPSFLGFRNAAFDKEAQASIDAAMIAARTYYEEHGDFNGTVRTSPVCNHTWAYLDQHLQKIEPNIDFIAPNDQSTGPRVVSIEANNTWNSNGENLGCQAFFATALSRSGTCWVGRITVEGQWLNEYGPYYDYAQIVVHGDKNSENASQVSLLDAPLNGNAFAAFKPQSSGADQDAIANESLAVAKSYCQAQWCLIDGEFIPGFISFKDYYDSWRNVTPGTPTTR